MGGLALAENCQQHGIPFRNIGCQSLCSYAPTAKFQDVAILRAEMVDVLAQYQNIR